jgi:NTE family protein
MITGSFFEEVISGMKLGLALSGGSIRGMSHVGALRALEEEGLKPNMIAGTSAGSIVASLYATGMPVDDMERMVIKYTKYMFDFDAFGTICSILRIGHMFKGCPVLSGLIRGNRIERIMEYLTDHKKIYQADIPLAITATDISDGRSVVFMSYKPHAAYAQDTCYCDDVYISEAVRASSAIPVVFKPKTINVENKNRRLVDGGVVNNLPIDALRVMGADRIIGINLGYSGQKQEHVDNIIEIGSQAIDIMTYQITQLRNEQENVIELVMGRSRPVLLDSVNREAVMINPHIYDVSIFEYHRIPECIERGYRAMKRYLPQIRRILNI